MEERLHMGRIRMNIPYRHLLFWAVFVVWLQFRPPRIIGDFNTRVNVFIVLCSVFYVAVSLLLQNLNGFRARVTIISAALILFPFVSYLVLSSFSSWCCVRPADFERMCDLAWRAVDMLEANNIPYWVCWGTLLGGVRESNMPYQTIPWEHDFDICVMDHDWERIKVLMKNTSAIIFNEKKKNILDTDYRTTFARAYVDVFVYSVSPSHK